MTNFQAICYTIVAMKALGYSKQEMEKVQTEMNWKMDTMSEEETTKIAIQILWR
jgi:Holliday junction resolvasome RuvABC DNA-binding subunit